MDPITAVGAVASIITLAQTALSLSKALYTLGSAVQSASEDIQSLADDLKIFAQSLSLLSRLLEDSKSWYSDDVYLLTAKIIKDCAELYVKIDKILVKLGRNGKNTWKLRMKFVYKEGEIRKLMKRLRDMKGTLATVLMSLQVDLQLSLLNISSSSKIRRPPEEELDSETIRRLKAAQHAVNSRNILPKYTSEPDLRLNDAKIHQIEVADDPQSIDSFARTTNTHSFIGLSGKQPSSDTVPALVCKSTTGPVFAKLNPANRKTAEQSSPRSLKSVSSTESFKSAVSVQKEVLDEAHEFKAVKRDLHAFRAALSTLETLITRRIPEDDKCYPVALQLKSLLFDGQMSVEDTHMGHCKKHGIHYVQKCRDTNSAMLHDMSYQRMGGVVISLHMLSDEHEVLTISAFKDLHQVSESCLRETLEALGEVANLASNQQNGIDTSCSKPLKFHGVILHEDLGSDDLYESCSEIPAAAKRRRLNAPARTQSQRGSLPIIGYLNSTWRRSDSTSDVPIFVHSRQPPVPSKLKKGDQTAYTGDEFEDDSPFTVMSFASDASAFGGRQNVVTFGGRQIEVTSSLSNYAEYGDDIEAMAGLPLSPLLRIPDELNSSEMLPESPAYSTTSPGYSPNTLGERGNSIALDLPENHLQHPFDLGGSDQDHDQPKSEEISDSWYTAFEYMRSSREMAYIVLSSQLETLGIETLPHPQIAKRLSKLVRDMPIMLNYGDQFAETLAIRDNIIAILKTVDEQLGLELAIVGWSCIWKLLSNYEDLMNSENKKATSTLKTTYAQLLEITGIMARYAVMENLYRNSPTLTLKPEYKSSLQSLCLSMLFYFSSAFELGRAQLTEVNIYGGMNEAVFNEEHKTGLEEQLQSSCENLMGKVRKADDLCRGFRVVVDVIEEDESDSEVSGEDESDGSLDQIAEEERSIPAMDAEMVSVATPSIAV